MPVNPKAFLALLGVLVLGACGGDTFTGVNGDASGTYTLRSIGGKPVPLTVSTGASSTVTYKSGSLTMNTGNTFSETLDTDQTVSGVVTSATSTCLGTYSQRGNGFSFSESASADPNCGFSYSGFWDGSNAFTVNFGVGAAAYYTK